VRSDVTEILRYAAFTALPEGGNPAGVVLDAGDLDAAAMQAIAAEVNYSETAFLLPAPDPRERPVRYYSPLAEVPFCGHATIAAAVAHAERHGPGRLVLHTRSGRVAVDTAADGGLIVATLVSVRRGSRTSPTPTSPRPSALWGGRPRTSIPPCPPGSPSRARRTSSSPPPPGRAWPGSTTTSTGSAR